jgi:ribosomal protein RSM22 (predicted rRNA methylase)
VELPAALRAGVERMLEGVPLADLQHAAARLSTRYRAETKDGRLHLDAELAVKAYLAARLPATYAAVRASLGAVAEALPDFEPKDMLDLGAGPGTALWAATDCWPDIGRATLLEASASARAAGSTLAEAQSADVQWLAGDVTAPLDRLSPADLVTIAYVLDELPPETLPALVTRLWSLTESLLVIVEPGTPAGWKRILATRDQLIAAGAHIIAPCPHQAPCPLAAPNWCHFSRKVARSRLHRLVKEAEVPWEDEKYIFLAASRQPRPAAWTSRVLAPPRGASGQIRLKLCQPDGTAAERLFTKRDASAFRAARRVDWGDTFSTGQRDA